MASAWCLHYTIIVEPASQNDDIIVQATSLEKAVR